MRGRLFLLVLALITVSMATFQRPWENRSWVANNPDIWSYGLEYWWNLPSLHKTIESLELPSSVQFKAGGDAAKEAEAAANYSTEAGRLKERCISDVIASIGIFPVVSSPLIMNTLSSSSSCMSYKDRWKKAVDSSLSALEESIGAARVSVGEARSSYDEILFMGLCDENYSGPGSGYCAELSGAFVSLDNGIKEGKYGKQALLDAYSRSIKGNLSEPEPDLSLYGPMLGLVWGEEGIVSEFREAQRMADEAKNDSEEEYLERLAAATGRKKLFENAMSVLRTEKLSLIGKAPASYGGVDTGSVKERLELLEAHSRALELALETAKLEHARSGKRGYMADSINDLAAAGEGYLEAIDSAASLRHAAETVVAQQKDEAVDELARAKKYTEAPAGSEALDYYGEALSFFEAGEGAQTLGDRFSYYSKAAAMARAARSSPDFEAEAASRESVSELKSLVARAESDQINVAAEKEILKLLPSLGTYAAEEEAGLAVDSVISKSRIKYEDDLLERRARIIDKLSLAGPEASDLYTDLSNYEDGLVTDAQVDFPDAIGAMKKLKSEYSELESTLDRYMSDIVGNSMSVEAEPLIYGVELDRPAGIILDAVMCNGRPYNATNVEASIHMGSGVKFLYSDITSGKDGVESLRAADGGKTLVLTFASVGPFETKRITLEREEILAHTIKNDTEAEGTGAGRASVTQKLTFELDSDIGGLSVPPGMHSATIDGLTAERPLAKGRHVMESQAVVEDAYGESVDNIKVYRIGTNSRVEYDVRLLPEMDLDRVRVFMDSLNDSRISSFDVSSATGEAVKEKGRISETQYAATVYGLKDGREAVLKVSYLVEDTESYVREQLAALGPSNLSPGAAELITQARIQSEAGNQSSALELIEKSLATEKQDEKENDKLQKDYEGLEKVLRGELDSLGSSLQGADSDSAFVQKLAARKAELERVFSEAAASNLSKKVELLEQVDGKWLDKELTSFKKESYNAYNDLKERFYEAGNSTTPPEFIRFEEAFTKFGSGGRLEYAMEVVEALKESEAVVSVQEDSSAAERNSMEGLLEDAKRTALETMERYSRQASEAKGTDYSSMFTETEKKLDNLIKEASDAIGSEPRTFSDKLDQIDKCRERMELTLHSLEDECQAKISMLDSLIRNKDVDEGKRAELLAKLDSVRNQALSGDYVNALRAGSAIGSSLDSEDEDNTGIMVIGATALAALAAAGFYVARQPREKSLRKLPSWTESTGLSSRPAKDNQSRSSHAPTSPKPPPEGSTPRQVS
jgi:hypothetical protein